MPTVLTDRDFGKSVTVRPGARLVVRLPENRTTGYAWHLQTKPDDGIKLVDERFGRAPVSADERMEGFAGGGAVHEFSLEARSPGTFVVLLRKMFGDEPEDDDRKEHLELVVEG